MNAEVVPPGFVHPRYGIARELLRFPTPLGLPQLHQVSFPLANHRRLRGTGEEEVALFFGTACETSLQRATSIAIGEAAERYAGTQFAGDELIEAKGRELGEPAALAPELIGFSRRTTARAGCPFVVYDHEVSRRWVSGRDLASDQPALMPAQAVVFDFPARPGELIVPPNTNGLAAGCSFDEAALAALLELIERDAFACHWLLRRVPVRIRVLPDDLEAALHPLTDAPGLRLELRWLETDLGLPVVLAVLVGRRTGAIAVGAACRPDARLAVRKAVLEAAHSWSYLTERRGRELPVPSAPAVRDFLDHAAFYAKGSNARNAAFLTEPAGPMVPLAELADMHPYTSVAPGDASRMLGFVVHRLTGQGFRPLVFDRTSPDVALFNLSVVRALVPGLQPLWTGKRWIPDDPRRLRSVARRYGLSWPRRLNRDIHPFP